MVDERRKYPRFRKDLPIVIHHPYNERKISLADVSLGGVAINNAVKYYDIHQLIKLEIILSATLSIFCDARVASITPRSKNAAAYKVDMQFVDMTDKDREKLKTRIEAPC